MTGSRGRGVLRPGSVLPVLLACVALLDAAGRLVPLEALAFRTWEAATARPAPRATFEPGRRFVVEKAFGDLVVPGNRPDLKEPRREVLTTDAWGLRSSSELLGEGPVEAVVFGDSFIGGAGVSDEERLSAQLHSITGRTVRDASGRLLTNLTLLRETAKRYGLRNGWIVFGSVGPHPLPVFPLHEARTSGEASLASGSPGFLSDLLVSRLSIVLGRGYRVLTNRAGVAGSAQVAVRRLPDGEELLFLRDFDEVPKRSTPEALESWRKLRELLESEGWRAAYVLVPSKSVVYGPLVSPPVPTARLLEAQLRAEAAGLASVGFVVVDASGSLSRAARDGLARHERVFWRDDTHWNPAGIRIVAGQLAEALGWAPRGVEPGKPGPEGR